jgi:hypothetical protein
MLCVHDVFCLFRVVLAVSDVVDIFFNLPIPSINKSDELEMIPKKEFMTYYRYYYGIYAEGPWKTNINLTKFLIYLPRSDASTSHIYV